MGNSWQKANTTTIWRGSSKHLKGDKILQYIKKKGVKAIILTPFSLYFTEVSHVVQVRAEGPKAPSPGHRPGYNGNQQGAL